jgi:Leucine-rich repeat (LRR) protein
MMKTKKILISLFIFLVISPLYAQTYSPIDTAALRAIDKNCDSSNSLNWDSEVDPGKWTGVTWNNSTPKRVSTLWILGEKLQDTMDVSPLTSLNYLNCNSNKLTGLDVSGLTNLQSLYCESNQLTDLDVSGLTNMNTLWCPYNQLTNLDISGLPHLQYLMCSYNQLASLNVSGVTNLQNLHCYFNQLTGLSVSGLTHLQKLYCQSNLLTNLDVSGLDSLNSLSCASNQITDLNVSGLTNLHYLYCQSNQLKKLNVSGLTNLYDLACHSNQLTNLNVSGLDSLCYLYCYSNQLINLNISGLTNLLYLSCGYNKLTDLNVSGLTSLGTLTCNSNQLTNLNVSGLDNLYSFNCESNQITDLNVSGLTSLQYLYCNHNKLPFSSLGKGLDVKVYAYNPQDSIFIARSVAGNITIDYSAEALINSQTTNFVFYKNNEQVEANNTGLYTTTGVGDYYCKMTNSLFSGLTLTTARISILQGLTVSPSAINMRTAPDTVTFTITSNTDWNVISSEAWLIVSAASGSNNGAITLTATENSGPTARTATLTISGNGVASQTVTVTQAANNITAVGELSYSGSCVYPNPMTDKISVRLATEDLPAAICMYNMEGTLLKLIKANSTITPIDMENYEPGTYILKIIMPTQIMTKKILKL